MVHIETNSTQAPPRAIFLDRDGVINVRRMDDYVKSWEEFIFLPGIFDVLPEIHRAGFLAVLVTNQRGVARSLMSLEDLDSIHRSMQHELELKTGHRFDAIYFCPHDRDAACNCRKPLPGMLLDAGLDLGIALERSWMIGDSESDIEAGIGAGCRTVKVDPEPAPSAAEFTAGDLAEAWSEIRRRESQPRPKA